MINKWKTHYLRKFSSSFHRPATTTFGRNNNDNDNDNNQSNDDNSNDNSSYERNKLQFGWRWSYEQRQQLQRRQTRSWECLNRLRIIKRLRQTVHIGNVKSSEKHFSFDLPF